MATDLGADDPGKRNAGSPGRWSWALRIVGPILVLLLSLFMCSTISSSGGWEVAWISEYSLLVLPWLVGLLALLAAGIRVPRDRIPAVVGYTVAFSLAVRLAVWAMWQTADLPMETGVQVLGGGYRLVPEQLIWSSVTVAGLCVFLALADRGGRRTD